MRPFAVCLIAAALLCAALPDAIHFGPRKSFQLEYSDKGSFGVRSHGVIENPGAGGGTKLYPLPQSTVDQYIDLRPADLKRNPIAATAGRYEREEFIGPYLVEADKLWFGNNFYDSEGSRGVGAFGYFDTATRQYRLFSPPEVAAYETSAILVEPDTVWLGLDQFVEDISTIPGGLVRWNRTTHQVRRYPIEFVVNGIAREGDSLHLTTSGGYALLKGDEIRRFVVKTGANGKMEATPIPRFPPPPSHY